MKKDQKRSHFRSFKQIEMLLEGAIERHSVYKDSSINVIVKDAQKLHRDPMNLEGIHREYFSYSLPLSGSTSESLMRMDPSCLSIKDYVELLSIFKSL